MKKIIILTFLVAMLSLNVSRVHAQFCFVDTFSTYSGILSDFIMDIAINKHNHVVTKHYSGISIYDGSKWTSKSVLDAQGMGIAIDNDDSVWCSSFSKGLLRIKDTNTTVFDTSNGLPGMSITEIKVGPDNKIYLGIDNFGLSIYDGKKFTNYDTNDGLCDPFIHTITFDKYGDVYIGSFNGCISKFDGTKFTDYPAIKGSGEFEVSKLQVDNNDVLWALVINFSGGNSSELYYFDKTQNKWVIISTPVSPTSHAMDFKIDPYGFFWLTADSNAYKWDRYKWHVYNASMYGISSIGRMAMETTGNPFFLIEGGNSIKIIKLTQTVKTELKTNITAGYVIYYKYNISGVKSFTKYDSVTATAFVTKNLPAGKYLIYVKPDPTVHTDLIGTYYGDVENWLEASHLELAFCDSFYMFQVTPVKLPPPPAGKGRISGYVKSADGTRGVAEPIKDVDVTLKKVPGGVIKVVKTDHTGLYEFTKLEEGTYGLIVDLPGLYQDSIPTVTITSKDTVFKNKDFKVDSFGVHLGDFAGIDYQTTSGKMRVYPNPASSYLTIDFETIDYQTYTLELCNLQGKSIYRNKVMINGNQQEIITLDSVTPGIYLLRIQSNDELTISKIQID